MTEIIILVQLLKKKKQKGPDDLEVFLMHVVGGGRGRGASHATLLAS